MEKFMSEDSRSVAQSIREKINAFKFNKGHPDPDALSARLDDLSRILIQEASKIARANDSLDQATINREVLNQKNVTALLGEVRITISKFDAAFHLAKNEIEQLGKIENGQGARRVIWRAASTASVATVIIIAWYVAYRLGIPLPFFRMMPTSSMPDVPS